MLLVLIPSYLYEFTRLFGNRTLSHNCKIKNFFFLTDVNSKIKPKKTKRTGHVERMWIREFATDFCSEHPVILSFDLMYK